MSSECSVNCMDNPDAVDKINYKCVECKRDLKARLEEVFTERQLAATKAEAEALASRPQQLTDEQIADRREMAKNG